MSEITKTVNIDGQNFNIKVVFLDTDIPGQIDLILPGNTGLTDYSLKSFSADKVANQYENVTEIQNTAERDVFSYPEPRFEIDKLESQYRIVRLYDNTGAQIFEYILDPLKTIPEDKGISVLSKQYGNDYGLNISPDPGGSFGQVKGSVTFRNTAQTKDTDVTSITLYYDPNPDSGWRIIKIPLSVTFRENLDATEEFIESYTFSFEKVKLLLGSRGGFVNFKLILGFNNGIKYESDIEKVSFSSVSAVQTFKKSQTNLDTDPASLSVAALKYEILTTISEGYYVNERSDINTENIFISDNQLGLFHHFLDTTRFKGQDYKYNRYVTQFSDSENGFIYQASGNESNQKGFFYPACVSEILPCINLTQGNSKQVRLSWKINKGFFDYNFLFGDVRVVTTKFTVDIQYYDSGGYQTIVSQREITIDDYDTENDLFIIDINSEKLTGNTGLLDKISLADNGNANLRLLITEYHAQCSFPGYSKVLEFDKLLLPPNWYHIVYDDYVSDITQRQANDTLSLELNAVQLRGIRIPERGFKYFDVLKDWEQTDDAGTFYLNTKILYKITSEATTTYTDPVRQGTITYVETPQNLDKVYLIAPDVILPEPNVGTKDGKAAAEVVLDEYGKISGIKITNPGYGYSMFKNATAKREQTVSDLTPVVRRRFTVLNQNSGASKSPLVPINNSYSTLEASIQNGKLLSDSRTNNSNLDARQREILNDYLQRNELEEGLDELAADEFQATDPYQNENNDSRTTSSLEDIDPVWFNIVNLYSDKDSNPIDEFNIYNIDLDENSSSLEDSSISDTINSAVNSLELSSTNARNENSNEGADTQEGFSVSNLRVYTDASPSITVFDASGAPPWLTLLPLESRSDGAAAHGTLPNMLTRAESFFNRLVDGVNNLNKVRLIMPTVWAIDLDRKTTQWFNSSVPQSEPITASFSTNGILHENTVTQSYYARSNSRNLGASFIRGVRAAKIDPNLYPNASSQYGSNVIVSSDVVQSMTASPMIHPFMVDAIPDLFRRSHDKKYLAVATNTTQKCSFYFPFNQNGKGIIGLGDGKQVEVPVNLNIPDVLTNTSSSVEFFNGGTFSVTPYGSAETVAFSYGGGYQNFSCGDALDLNYDFGYSNLYPAILTI